MQYGCCKGLLRCLWYIWINGNRWADQILQWKALGNNDLIKKILSPIIMDFQRSVYQRPNLMNLNCSPNSTTSSNLNHRFFESQIQILLKSLNLKRQYVVQRRISNSLNFVPERMLSFWYCSLTFRS